MLKKHIIIVLLSITFINTFGQNKDVLNKVKELNTKKDYKTSMQLLEQSLKTHKDLYTYWLYGETLHADKRYKKAVIAYRKALNLDPDNSVLKYDYALKLADAGKLNESISLLKQYADYKNAYQFLALKQLAKVYYWQGAYDKAQKTLQRAQKIKNEHEIDWLRGEIHKAQRSDVSVGFAAFSDDQPLDVYTPDAGVNFYINEKISAGATLTASQYNLEDTANLSLLLKPFVTINFLPAMVSTRVELGYEKLPNDENVITGGISISKGISKNWSANAGFSTSPYLHTAAAIQENLMQNQYSVALDYNKKKGFMGRIGFDSYQFPSLQNGYYATGAWLLSPQVFLGNFGSRLGVGVSYSDAVENTFTASDDLPTILTNYVQDYKIKGVYQPFFSPSKQFISSVIISTEAHLSPSLHFGADANLGVYANTQNPYLFLNADSNSLIYIDRGFAKMNYFPVTANIFLNVQLSSKLSIKTYYKYQSTNYYSSNLAGINAHYSF